MATEIIQSVIIRKTAGDKIINIVMEVFAAPFLIGSFAVGTSVGKIAFLFIAGLFGSLVLLNTLVRTRAPVPGSDFARIQFTPDLMPADITGTSVFNLQRNEFSLIKGPVFTSFLLADEINRAPAKTQSASLQAMQERVVTIDSETHPLSACDAESEPNPQLTRAELQRFHGLYERTAADLAKPVTFSSEPETRRYLENLIARAYGEIHERRATRSAGFFPLRWFFQTLPQTFCRHLRAFYLSLAITLARCAFGGVATAFDPDRRVRGSQALRMNSALLPVSLNR